MYASIYVYRVPRDNVDAFLRVGYAAANIYREFGAVNVEIFRGSDMQAKYGCATYSDVLETVGDEVVLVEIDRFRDREHHDEVMTAVDADKRIDKLYEEMSALIHIGQVVRGEFELAS